MTNECKRSLVEPDNKRISVSRQCELFGMPRSSFYYSPWQWNDTAVEIMNEIDEEYTRHPFRGKRMMCDYLIEQGWNIGVKRTRTLMRWMGLESTSPKPNLSKPHPQHPKFPYLLGDIDITSPNKVWASDITYIRLAHGFVYLTAVYDWFSRYVISWELSTTLDNDFCVRCLEESLRDACPEYFNTDQGVQYTSTDFIETLRRHPIQISMDGKGRAFDNIMIERLWRTVKYEEVYLKSYDDVADCRRSLGEYFRFYNEERRHSTLKCTPHQKYFGE